LSVSLILQTAVTGDGHFPVTKSGFFGTKSGSLPTSGGSLHSNRAC
jgi:hypothetical protein